MKCILGRPRGRLRSGRSLYTHVLDAAGQTVLEKDLPASPSAFLDAVKPFRDGLVAVPAWNRLLCLGYRCSDGTLRVCV